MKKKYIILPILILIGNVHATTLSTNVSNFEGVGDELTSVVLDNVGAQISSGFIALGTFNVGNSVISSLTSSQSLSDAFFNISSTDAAGNFGSFGGTFQFTVDGDTDTVFDGAQSFSGLNAYIVIGNAANLVDSTQFLVWDSGVSFDSALPLAGPTSLLLDTAVGTTVIGSETAFTFDLSGVGGSATEAAFSTAALVPEPSSTLLIGLAGIGMTLRRRR